MKAMKLKDLLKGNRPHDCAKTARNHPQGYICDRCGEDFSPHPKPVPGNLASRNAHHAGAPQQAVRMVTLLVESMLDHSPQR